MLKKISFDDLTEKIISIKPTELTLMLKRKLSEEITNTKCNVNHNLEYVIISNNKKDTFDYSFNHSFLINNLDQKGLVKWLHEDLSKVMHQGKKLKSKGINLKISLKGMALPYLGQSQYLNLEELDILSLPNLLLDMKRYYRLK